MKKFLEYVYMRDYNNEYLFPSPIGHIIFVILIFICIAICNFKGKEDEVKHLDMTIDSTRVDSVYQVEEVIIENDSVFSVPKGHHWKGKEIGLPIGIVYMMDYAGSASKNDKDHILSMCS